MDNARPPMPPSGGSGSIVAMAVAGVFTWFGINVAIGVLVTSTGIPIGIGAVTLFVLAFGGGGALIAMRKPPLLGLGLGLMIGWALASLVTVGYCTGLNPEMYETWS